MMAGIQLYRSIWFLRTTTGAKLKTETLGAWFIHCNQYEAENLDPLVVGTRLLRETEAALGLVVNSLGK